MKEQERREDMLEELKIELREKLKSDREQNHLMYNKLIENSYLIEDPASLFEFIIDIYHDKQEREDALIELMRISLTDDFFRDAKIERGKHSLSFSNEDYTIHFSTVGIKVITLDYKVKAHPQKVRIENPVMKREEEEYKRDLLEKFKIFSKDKSFKNFKVLSEIYNKYNQTAGLMAKYSRTFKECNPNLEALLIRDLESNEDRKNINRLALDIYRTDKDKAIKFLSQLNDLKVYKENNWTFMLLDGSDGGITLTKDELIFE